MASTTAVELHGQEASPIQALGSLFKLTEVYLWEDGTTETLQPFSINRLPHINGDVCSEFDSATSFGVTSGTRPSPEELELIEQMDALGLPISFQTNKKKQKGITKVKKKSTKLKHSFSLGIENQDPESLKVSDEDVVSPSVFHDNLRVCSCSTSMPDQSELSSYDVSADAHISSFSSGEGEFTSLTGIDLCSIKELSVETPCESITLPDYQSIGNDYMSKSESTVGRDIDDPPIEACAENDDRVGSGMEPAFNNNDSSELLLPEDLAFSSNTEVLRAEEGESCKHQADYSDWVVCWDDFYQRSYFYNTKTQDSTWFPPPGMEHEVFAVKDCSNESDGMLIELREAEVNPAPPEPLTKPENSSPLQITDGSPQVSISKFISCGETLSEFPKEDEVRNVQGVDTCTHDEVMLMSSSENQKPNGFEDDICREKLENAVFELLDHTSMTNFPPEVVEEDTVLHSDELYTQANNFVEKKKKRSRRKRAENKSTDVDEDGKFPLLEECSAIIEKYWYQRYLLFSKFDEGVKMDEEGWFSVTPESIAKHHALQCGSGVIIDGFTGVGGNAIQLAERAKHVIAIDIDPMKIEYAQHNAIVYKVDHHIDFLNGNFFHLAPKLKADTVFLSPPWGGPGYTKVKRYDIKTMLKPCDGLFLFNTSKEIAPRIVMFLPKNVDLNQLAELALSADPPWSLEVERNFLNRKLKAVTAYFTKQQEVTTE